MVGGSLGRNEEVWLKVSGHRRSYSFLKGLNLLKTLGCRDSASSKHKQKLIEQQLKAPGACEELLAIVV